MKIKFTRLSFFKFFWQWQISRVAGDMLWQKGKVWEFPTFYVIWTFVCFLFISCQIYALITNQRNQNLIIINTYGCWHKIKKEMQNTDKLPLRPAMNFYLPGLEKHLIYIFSSRKSNIYSLFYGLVQTSQGEIGNYFY